MVTLEVAVAVVAVSVLVGVPAAYALARREFPGKRAVILLFLLPILIPPITTASRWPRCCTSSTWPARCPA